MDWNSFTDFVSSHAQLAWLITFAVAFLESLAFVGIIMPGAAAIIAIGALVGAGHLGFWETTLAGIVGAAAGDGLSYALGRRYHGHIRDFRLVRRYERFLDLGERYFQSRGTMSIVVGRFVGPMRPFMPLVAGMLDMPLKRFLLADWVASIGWAPVYLAPGILVGAAAHLEANNLSLFYWQLGGFWVLLWTAIWALRAASRLRRNDASAVPTWLAGRPFTLLLPGSIAGTIALLVALNQNPASAEFMRVLGQVLSR